jgi:hypothetical protein
MEASRMEVYLGARCRRGTELLTKEFGLTSLRNHFSGLTPKLLGRIRPFAENNLIDMIKIPESLIKVPAVMLGTELRNITLDSPVLLIEKGADFNVVSPDPKTVGDAVGIMQQIFSTYGSAGSYSGNGKMLHYAIDEELKNVRGVSVWLDEIQGEEAFNKNIGMFMSFTRFFGSTLDHIEIAIPLGMTVVDQKKLV